MPDGKLDSIRTDGASVERGGAFRYTPCQRATAERTARALVERRRELGFPVTLVGSFDFWTGWDGDFGAAMRDGLRKAGIPDTVEPEDLHLPPEQRLTGDELRAIARDGYVSKGRMPGGVYVLKREPSGEGVLYFNGQKVSASKAEIRGDTFYRRLPDGKEQSCAVYRNPKGRKASLDELISVCTNGVFFHAVFPLSEAAR